MITRQTIEEAHARIEKYINRTPVLHVSAIDELAGCEVWFKCENLQKVGAFKARGAMNAVLSLTEQQRQRGVGTHSSGNHAQALARAAKILGIPAYIVMPRNAPKIKKSGVLSYGGRVFECEPNLAARETTLAKVLEETGATEIHPFNNESVIAGQATAALELLQDRPALDVLFAPVGGGGLLSGTCLSARYFSPSSLVYGAEPSGADDAFRSLQSGKIEPSQADTIADGLLTTLGDITFPLIREHVSGIITVADQEIVLAMQLIWEKLKVIAEPSAAVPLAALLKQPGLFAGKRVGIILSGGNIDLERACRLFEA